jgi:hypothetical protein
MNILYQSSSILSVPLDAFDLMRREPDEQDSAKTKTSASRTFTTSFYLVAIQTVGSTRQSLTNHRHLPHLPLIKTKTSAFRTFTTSFSLAIQTVGNSVATLRRIVQSLTNHRPFSFSVRCPLDSLDLMRSQTSKTEEKRS